MTHSAAPSDIAVVDEWGPWSDLDEPMGARDKVWIDRDQAAPTPGWLFKHARAAGKLPETGGDLCAEVVASHIARRMGVSTVNAQFATRHGAPGVLIQRIPGDLLHGNELLPAIVDGYDQGKTRKSQYTLNNIRRALEGYGSSGANLTAYESFVGYIHFDALVANTDRHHENWAVTDGPAGQHLAPTYDHGASLAFNARSYDVSGVERFAARGRSTPFQMPLIELARAALASVSPSVQDLVSERLATIDREWLESLVAAVPSTWMSPEARAFVVELVLTNQRRLLS